MKFKIRKRGLFRQKITRKRSGKEVHDLEAIVGLLKSLNSGDVPGFVAQHLYK